MRNDSVSGNLLAFATALVLALWISGCHSSETSPGYLSESRIDWIHHVDSLLMPFWMTDDALGNPPGNFPAYRYPDGTPVDPDNLDYSTVDPKYQQFYMANTDSLQRDFVRVKSRQIWRYCMAFHTTGIEKYLEYGRRNPVLCI